MAGAHRANVRAAKRCIESACPELCTSVRREPHAGVRQSDAVTASVYQNCCKQAGYTCLVSCPRGSEGGGIRRSPPCTERRWVVAAHAPGSTSPGLPAGLRHVSAGPRHVHSPPPGPPLRPAGASAAAAPAVSMPAMSCIPACIAAARSTRYDLRANPGAAYGSCTCRVSPLCRSSERINEIRVPSAPEQQQVNRKTDIQQCRWHVRTWKDYDFNQVL